MPDEKKATGQARALLLINGFFFLIELYGN